MSQFILAGIIVVEVQFPALIFSFTSQLVVKEYALIPGQPLRSVLPRESHYENTQSCNIQIFLKL